MHRSDLTCHLRTICKAQSRVARAARARGSRALASAEMLTHSVTLANSPQLVKLFLSWKQNCTKKQMLWLSFAPLGGLSRAYQQDGHRERDRLRATFPTPILPTLSDSLKPKELHYQTSSHPAPLQNYLTGKGGGEENKKRKQHGCDQVNFVTSPCSGLSKVFSKLSSSLYFPFFLLPFFFLLSLPTSTSINSPSSSHFPYHDMINSLSHTSHCTCVCIPVWQKTAFNFTCTSGLPLKVISSTSQRAASTGPAI